MESSPAQTFVRCGGARRTTQTTKKKPNRERPGDTSQPDEPNDETRNHAGGRFFVTFEIVHLPLSAFSLARVTSSIFSDRGQGDRRTGESTSGFFPLTSCLLPPLTSRPFPDRSEKRGASADGLVVAEVRPLLRLGSFLGPP
ncbi:hypothetical protein DPEC_G00182690 [Dallia pectoralis]|uniref:Uncharacterized protein n=1 Tax=Dallia pectoralis TaxID=75939 RepID=A0ACC2GAK4_DALPE|nr:hypothetical protein DPEC_G00182690 [Dallia pectoralis]